MIKHQNKYYSQVEAGPWVGFQEIKVTEAQPLNRWRGLPIPWELWDQVASFLAWGFAETKAEVVAHFFYDPDIGKWAALVLPQKGYSGMSVSLIEDHENRPAAFENLGPGNWFQLGSVHTHCNSTAFASGVDDSDEIGKDGLHLTIGKQAEPILDLHSRVVFRRTRTGAALEDWFTVPDEMVPAVSAGIADPGEAVAWRLRQRVSVEFPAWWKENVINVPRPALPSYNGGTWTPSAREGAVQKFSDGLHIFEDGRWVPLKTATPEPDEKAHEILEERIISELEGIAKQFHSELSDVESALQDITTNPIAEALLDLAATHNADVSDLEHLMRVAIWRQSGSAEEKEEAYDPRS